MPRTLTSTALIDFPPFGPVLITPRANARSVRLRVKSDGSYAASIPLRADFDRAVAAIRELLPRLQSKVADKPAFRYTEGHFFTYPEGKIIITRQDRHPRSVTAAFRDGDIVIGVGRELSLDDHQTTLNVSNLIKRMAGRVGHLYILPGAREAARRIGVEPDAWNVSHGLRTLGTCFPRERRINLSCHLMFLPRELRDYIVCHELAHLTHADHSPAFHSLCDAYCLGREKQLVAELRRFRWPILR